MSFVSLDIGFIRKKRGERSFIRVREEDKEVATTEVVLRCSPVATLE